MSSPSANAARDPKAGYSARHELLVSRTGAGLPSYSFSSVSVDIKAFKGKGAFRSLSRQFANSVAQTRDAMDALALDTTRFEAGCYLRLVEERGRGALGRTRLRWCIRGQARYVRFEALRDVLAGLPPSVVEHFRNCEVRAAELNVLENVLRHAVDQVESYLRNGALRQRTGFGELSAVLLQNSSGNGEGDAYRTLGGEAAMGGLILLLLAAAMFANGLAAIGLLVWAIFLFLVDADIWGIPFVGSCLCLVLAAWAYTAFDDRIARATVLRQNTKPYERNQQP